ncbi:unnamed protein product [Symbiodinium sp. CCMP2592]|nr:unnamed protein product [Symbiodinium sp. CCMP2592]
MDAAPDASVAVPEPCPILMAWSKSHVVMSQLVKAKRLLLLQHNKLNRAVLVDNMEVLACGPPLTCCKNMSQDFIWVIGMVAQEDDYNLCENRKTATFPARSESTATVSQIWNTSAAGSSGGESSDDSASDDEGMGEGCGESESEEVDEEVECMPPPEGPETPDLSAALDDDPKPEVTVEPPRNTRSKPKAPNSSAHKPEVTGARENPSSSSKPEVTGAPETSSKPEVTEAPKNPTRKPDLEVTGAPGTSSKPEVTAEPKNPARKPEITGAPENPTRKPDHKVTGGAPENPRKPGHKVTAGAPENPRKPGHKVTGLYRDFFWDGRTKEQVSRAEATESSHIFYAFGILYDCDADMHYKCLNCGDTGGLDDLRIPELRDEDDAASQAASLRLAQALDDELSKGDDAASQAASLRLAQALQAEDDKEFLEHDLEAELLAEQLSLEELILQAEEGELQRLLAQEEADLLQAKVQSLGSMTASIGELMPPPSIRKARESVPAELSSSSHDTLHKLPPINPKRTLEPELEACKEPEAEAKKPRIVHETEHKQPKRAADVQVTMCLDNVDTLPNDFDGLDDAVGCMQAAKVQDLGEGSGVGLLVDVPSEAPVIEQKECEPPVSVSVDGALADDKSDHDDDGVSLSIGTVHYSDGEKSAAEEAVEAKLPECPDTTVFKPMSPSEQMIATGAVPKKTKKTKQSKACEETPEEPLATTLAAEEPTSCRGRGGSRGRGRGRGKSLASSRGRGGKGKGRGGRKAKEEVPPSPPATEADESQPEASADEHPEATEEEEEDKIEETAKPKVKRGPAAKPKSKATAKSKNARKKDAASPKAKAKAKSSAKPKPKAKEDPKPKAGATKRPRGSASRDKAEDQHDESKARKSRKSVAYHKAMSQAKSEGKPLEACKAAAKAVS